MQEKKQAANTSQPTPSQEPQAPSDLKEPSQSQKEPFFLERIQNHFFLSSFVGFLVLIGIVVFVVALAGGNLPQMIPSIINQVPSLQGEKVVPFTSQEEFAEYIKQSEGMTMYGAVGMGSVNREMATFEGTSDMAITAPLANTALKFDEIGGPARVSETNVQVKGIDEPDILKTDGKTIFFSGNQVYYPRPMPMMEEPDVFIEREEIGMTVPAVDVPPQPVTKATKIVDAFPPAELEMLSGIEEQGELLLNGDQLLIFLYDKIVGYDVSKPEAPKKLWTFELDRRNTIVSSRLFDGTVYVVAQASVSSYQPCPIPLRTGTGSLSIACNEIYHPISPVPVNSTFTVFTLNSKTGEVGNKISFVGSSGQSVVYMSQNGIYVTYPSYMDVIRFLADLFKEEGKGLIPQTIIDRMDNLQKLEISQQAKMVELQQIMEDFTATLSDDDSMKLENEMQNRMERYMKAHLRDFERTGVVKVGLGNFSIEATGLFPGMPLNQFSLDEYKGYLRVATTVSGGMLGNSSQTENDVYVLDSGLNVVGSVKGMGLTERVYSARFVGDRGYVVTFRQVDPFYVLDLSDPKNPQLKGELKIPGYSSYLHPIREGMVLGVGEEGNKVKLALFGVTDASNPTEESKYLLDEYYSEIAQTHHAFLQDEKHKIFFLPGGKGGYIFSYQGDQINLERAVSNVTARRALFINDYLYIVGDDKIVVLNEADWEEVNRLVF